MKGLPLGFDIFENHAMPKKGLGAETYEEIILREAGHVQHEPDVFPMVFIG